MRSAGAQVSEEALCLNSHHHLHLVRDLVRNSLPSVPFPPQPRLPNSLVDGSVHPLTTEVILLLDGPSSLHLQLSQATAMDSLHLVANPTVLAVVGSVTVLVAMTLIW